VSDNILPLLGSLGLPAAIISILLFLIGTKKSKIEETVNAITHTIDQNNSEKKIESIETEQTKVIAVIKDKENISVETQKKIRDITDDAVQKIEEVKKSATIKDIQKTIDSGWSEL